MTFAIEPILPQAAPAAYVANKAMIAFFVPPELTEALVLAAQVAGVAHPQPPHQLHLTLVYLGDLDTIGPYYEAIRTVLRETMTAQSPFSGLINGIGRFTHESDGEHAVYASFDAVALPALVQCLTSCLLASGVPLPQTHGFVPHITLGYIPPDCPTPDIRLPRWNITCYGVVLAWGDQRETFYFGLPTTSSVPTVPGQPPFKHTLIDLAQRAGLSSILPTAWMADAISIVGGKAFSARAGEVIQGNLIRGSDGKFASAGNPGPSSEKKPADETTGKKPHVDVVKKPAPKAAAKKPKKKTTKKQAKSRDEVAAAVGDEGGALSDLDALSNGGEPKNGDALVEAGLARRALDGSLITTPKGRQALRAALRGDEAATRNALAEGKDNVAKQKEREAQKQQKAAETEQKKQARLAEREQKKQAREAEKQKKAAEREQAKQKKAAEREQAKQKKAAEREQAKQQKAADAAKKKEERTQAKAAERGNNRKAVLDEVGGSDYGMSPKGADALLAFGDGGNLDESKSDELERRGLIERGADGSPRLTRGGRAVITAFNKGDVRGAYDAISRAADDAPEE